ncbi:MAG: rhodanese-like domain-containing protein [Desulfobacter sp.]|nr:MAG: rhodanese-like domain-containing protein [Desulfobacter sp.]
MARRSVYLMAACLSLLFNLAWAGQADKVSGALINGFRVLNAEELARGNGFSVFRGDYIKFDLGSGRPVLLSIPALGIEGQLAPDQGRSPYFKMKQTGIFDIYIGDTAGTIRVIEYAGAHYRAVSAKDAQEVIQTFSPLILDVRTPKEFNQARIKNAVLIPVQELQKRWTELSARKDDPILIYCATGNRSTVASKILIDRGFTRIFNLRHGIVDWYRKKYPVIQ